MKPDEFWIARLGHAPSGEQDLAKAKHLLENPTPENIAAGIAAERDLAFQFAPLYHKMQEKFG